MVVVEVGAIVVVETVHMPDSSLVPKIRFLLENGSKEEIRVDLGMRLDKVNEILLAEKVNLPNI